MIRVEISKDASISWIVEVLLKFGVSVDDIDLLLMRLCRHFLKCSDVYF